MKPLVSVEELRRVMTRLNEGRAARYTPLLGAAMEEFDIASKKRRCAFLSQLAHESVELRYMEEIASGSAYEGRADLGNTHPGDGKRYKGRGPIQLTGRANYRRFGKILGLDLEGQPELAALPQNGFRIAALFWKLGGLNELADELSMKGDVDERKVFTAITKRINGGTNGLTNRLNYFRIAKQVLHNDDEPQPEPSAPSPIAPPVARAESPTEVSANNETDLVDAAVNSATVKQAAPKLWPRVVVWFTYLGALYETHKVIGSFVILGLLIAAGVVVHWKWAKIKPQILKLLK